MESTCAINVLQNLDHCFTITIDFSIVLKGLVDSESRFSFIDIGACGKQSDGGRFSASTVCRFSEDFEYNLPKPASFEGSGKELPFVVLGDKAYPLKSPLTLILPRSRTGTR